MIPAVYFNISSSSYIQLYFIDKQLSMRIFNVFSWSSVKNSSKLCVKYCS